MSFHARTKTKKNIIFRTFVTCMHVRPDFPFSFLFFFFNYMPFLWVAEDFIKKIFFC